MTKKHAAEVLADECDRSAEGWLSEVKTRRQAAVMLRTIPALEAERDALRAEVEALRADAERYRWLRNTLHSAVGGGIEVNDQRLVYEDPEPGDAVRLFWYPSTPIGFYQYQADNLDEAIDAARKS